MELQINNLNVLYYTIGFKYLFINQIIINNSILNYFKDKLINYIIITMVMYKQ